MEISKYDYIYEQFDDANLYKQGYFVIQVVKNFIFGMILVSMNDLVLGQQLMFLFLNLGSFLLLVKIKPYPDQKLYYRDFTTELGYVIIHVCFISIASFQSDLDKREFLGSLTLIILWVILGAQTVYLLYESFLSVRALCKKKNQTNHIKLDSSIENHRKNSDIKNEMEDAPDKIPD